MQRAWLGPGPRLWEDPQAVEPAEALASAAQRRERESQAPVSSPPAGRRLPGLPAEGVRSPLISPLSSRGFPNPLRTALGMVAPVLFILKGSLGPQGLRLPSSKASRLATWTPHCLPMASTRAKGPLVQDRLSEPTPALAVPTPVSLQAGPLSGVWPRRVVKCRGRAG